MSYVLFDIEIRDGQYEYGEELWTETDGTEKNLEACAIEVLLNYSDVTDEIKGTGVFIEVDLFDRIIRIDGYTVFETKDELKDYLLKKHEV